MKIGIVCYPTFGGSGVVATELGNALADKGHKIHFITYRRPPRLSGFHENITYHEVSALDYPLFEFKPYDSTLASKLVNVVVHEKLDVLHVHYAIPHASVAYLAKQILRTKGINLPVVTTLHGTDITLVGTDKSFAPVVEFSINQSDGVTAVSESLKAQTLNTFEITTPVEVIHNFIDFNRFNKINKDHFKKAIAPNGEKIITHVSNFRKVKRVQDVIHVFKKIQEELPAKLFLIGDGPERSSLEELCRSLNLCHNINFLGKQEAVEELLAVSDLFVMPSEKESFGLAALEAMACQVPVISSNAGGLEEVNINGYTGFVSQVGDVQDMAINSIHALNNQDVMDRLREGAYEQAKGFQLEIIVPKYESFYQQIIENVKHNVL